MRNKTFSNEQLQSDRIVPITNSCEWQKHPLYQIFRILLPIFPSLTRLCGGSCTLSWSKSSPIYSSSFAVPASPPALCPPGSVVLPGVRRLVPLSRILSPCHEDNKYRLIFEVNCFLFLIKLPQCEWEGKRANPPTLPASFSQILGKESIVSICPPGPRASSLSLSAVLSFPTPLLTSCHHWD